MLKRSRVSGSMDVNRLSEAVARPGIDPRTWVTLATVKKFVMTSTGPYADVEILSDMTIDDFDNPVAHVETARVAPMYAGDGYGFYAPLQVNDEVVVGYPDGNPDHGLVVIGRCWSKADPPPSLGKDNPQDVCLQVLEDTNLRIQVFGSGNVVLGSEDGKVLLGEESASRGVARADDNLTASAALKTWASQVESGIAGAGGTPPVPTFASAVGSAGQLGTINSASDKVKST